MASAAVAPLPTPVPWASTGAAGADRSSTKLVMAGAAVWALPAASVCTAETLIVPSPKVLKSSALSTTATGVASAPVTVFSTVPPPARLNLTNTEAPCSAVTATTPVVAEASAEVAPLPTPTPSNTPGATAEGV